MVAVAGICPNCRKPLVTCQVHSFNAGVSGSHPAVQYICPNTNCRAVISIVPDPNAVIRSVQAPKRR